MANKNDLSAYKRDNVQALKTTPTKASRVGKPPKEKRSYKTLLSLTEAEGKAVEEKAGMVPVATYLVAKLREAGVFE